MSYLSILKNGTVLLHLHVQPKASKSRIMGFHDGCLKLAVAAPPVEGKANKAVVKFLAQLFGLPARDVVVKAGAQSRRKQVVIKALSAAEIRAVIETTLSCGS
jgi:uncharacterized protein